MKVEIEVESMPAGFRAVAYRPLEKGEWFLGANKPVLSTSGHSAPWLILEKIDQDEKTSDLRSDENGGVHVMGEWLVIDDEFGDRRHISPDRIGKNLPEVIAYLQRWQATGSFDSCPKEQLKDINEVRGARLKKLEQEVSGLRESCLKLANRLVATEEAQSLHMDGVAKRLEKVEQLTEIQSQNVGCLTTKVNGNMSRVLNLEESLAGMISDITSAGADHERHIDDFAQLKGFNEKQREGQAKPQPYGLWNLDGGNWHSKSPFESAGDVSRYAAKTLHSDWRNYWRVYPYPEDGGKPVELREEKWGLWGGTGGSEPYWFGQEDEGVCLESEEDIQEVRSLLEFPERWKPYPYPADGGMPMELREGKKQIDRPTVYYVRNKTTGNFLRRVDQKDRNTLFVTEDQALAEHMAQGTEGGPYEVYPVTLGE